MLIFILFVSFLFSWDAFNRFIPPPFDQSLSVYLACGRGLHLVISHRPHPGLQQPTGHTGVLTVSSPGCCTPHAPLKDMFAL